MEFENGIPAVFHYEAPLRMKPPGPLRSPVRKGKLGGIWRKQEIQVLDFEKCQTRTYQINAAKTGHGGGDEGIVRELLLHLNDRSRPLPSSLELSVQSHMMAFAAEESMQSGKVVDVKEFAEG